MAKVLELQLILTAAAAAKSLQSCPTLCDPIDGSPPGSAIPGILQARVLEWGAIVFNAWKWKVKVKSLSRVQLLAPHGLQPTRLLHPWDFPGKSTGVGCHCLLRHSHYFSSTHQPLVNTILLSASLSLSFLVSSCKLYYTVFVLFLPGKSLNFFVLISNKC